MEKSLSTSAFKANPWITPALVLLLFVAAEAVIRFRSFGLVGIVHPLRYHELSLSDLGVFEAAKDPQLGFLVRPNLDTYYRGSHFTTNQYGARGPRVTLDKPPGVIRIVVLGISTEFGQGVSDDEVFSQRLENLLNQDRPGGYEVQNFAMAGYDTYQNIRLYDERVRQMSPDVVLYGTYPRDLLTTRLVRRLPKFTPEPALFDVRSYGGYWFGYSLLRKAWTTNGIMEDWSSRAQLRWTKVDSDTRARIQLQLGPGNMFSAATMTQPPGVQAQRSPKDELDAFVQARHDEGKLLVLMRLRMPLSKDIRPAQVHQQMEQLCTPSARCVVVDTHQSLQGRIGPDDVVSGSDGHPNARVHGLYADILYQALQPLLAKRQP
jgi:hypothetical protein